MGSGGAKQAPSSSSLGVRQQKTPIAKAALCQDADTGLIAALSTAAAEAVLAEQPQSVALALAVAKAVEAAAAKFGQ